MPRVIIAMAVASAATAMTAQEAQYVGAAMVKYLSQIAEYTSGLNGNDSEHMTTTKATAIRYYDVVIVGGGIGGIAIAEFLSRQHQLSTKVLDHAPQLGTGASGKLEGWFHAGGLYSSFDDGQTFMNCLNAIEDLITQYAYHFPERCNLTCAPRYPGICSPEVVPRESGWFNDSPVFYIHPTQGSTPGQLSNFKNDAVPLEIQRQRVLGRMEGR